MNKGKLVFLKQFINENASLHGDNPEAILKILIAVQKASTNVCECVFCVSSAQKA